MSTEANQSKSSAATFSQERILQSTQQFWSKNSKWIVGVFAALMLGGAGYFGYHQLIIQPAEEAAVESLWTAQANFKIDSFNLALKGDGTKNNPGLLKVISKHEGTRAANLAHFYAGICYLHLGEYAKAVSQLEDFDTDDPPLLMRKYGSLGDALAEQGKLEPATANYRKAASAFESDDANASEYLFRLGQLYDKQGKTAEAIEAFQSIKEKFPFSMRANEVDKYLARLGETQ